MTKHTKTAEILTALETTRGDITKAANMLGMRREALYYRMNKEAVIKETAERLRAEREPLTIPADPSSTNDTAELLKHYKNLEENARRELIPIAEGLRPTPAKDPAAIMKPNADILATAEEPRTEPQTAQDPQEPPTPTPAPLPYVAQIINRQEAHNLAQHIRAYIQHDGLPCRYHDVFNYLEYLDRKAKGTA